MSKNHVWMAILQNGGATVGPFVPACFYHLTRGVRMIWFVIYFKGLEYIQ